LDRIGVALVVTSIVLLGARPGGAIPVGTFSFDAFGGFIPELIDFSVSNLTGDPAAGGAALPPDFPVFDPVIFGGAGITLALSGGSTEQFALGDIGPGSVMASSLLPDPTTPPSFFTVDPASILSAVLSMELNQTSFVLADGRTFLADSPTLTATLLPPPGGFVPGDAVVIDVSGTIQDSGPPTPVPEPATLLLVLAGVGGVWMAATARRSGHRREP
jgi:hypothetical protein